MHNDNCKTIGIIIADSNPLHREKIKEVIADSKTKNIKILGEAGSKFDAEKMTEARHPDILLLDMALIVDSGMNTIKFLKDHHERLRILVLNNDPDPAYRELALLAGAHAVCLKERIVHA